MSQSCAPKTPFTADALKKLLDYDPGTGVFRWRYRPKFKWTGRVAGCVGTHGYSVIVVSGHSCKAHRLAWLYVTGEWPSKDIDHIDGEKTNNRFANLREADDSQNKANCRAYRKSASGLKGASKHNCGRWQSSILVRGKMHYLGLFATPEAAHEAYCAAAREHFGKFFRAA